MSTTSSPRANPRRVYAVKLHAPNTPAGNPQRCWWVYDRAGRALGTIDEGYHGDSILWRWFPNVVLLGTFKVAAREYHECARGALRGVPPVVSRAVREAARARRQQGQDVLGG